MMMITPALTIRLNSGRNPDTRIPVFIAWMISAPTTDMTIENRPPISDVPPITTAAITEDLDTVIKDLQTLISAKPENRRKVLEEAAGVGGMMPGLMMPVAGSVWPQR